MISFGQGGPEPSSSLCQDLLTFSSCRFYAVNLHNVLVLQHTSLALTQITLSGVVNTPVNVTTSPTSTLEIVVLNKQKVFK